MGDEIEGVPGALLTHPDTVTVYPDPLLLPAAVLLAARVGAGAASDTDIRQAVTDVDRLVRAVERFRGEA